MISIRPKQITDINYVFIPKRHDAVAPFLAPLEFKSNVVEILRKCPVNLYQLIDALQYYEVKQSLPIKDGYSFQVVYSDSIEYIKNTFKNSKQVQFFIIDSDVDNIDEIVGEIFEKYENVRYFHIIGNSKKHLINHVNAASSAADFLLKLVNNGRLLDIISEINPNTDISLLGRIKFDFFNGTRNNYFTYSNIIGNYFIGDEVAEGYAETSDETRQAAAIKAIHEKNTFDRQLASLKQVIAIDNINHVFHNLHNKFLITLSQPALSPLIIIAPFHNPDIAEMYPAIDTSLLMFEQSSNYTGESRGEIDDKLKMSALLANFRLKYLDSVAYLHASFDFSPAIRLPAKGKSIYRELSFFGAGRRSSNLKKIKKTIANFSKKYQKEVLCEEVENYLAQRDGQVIVISDLPLEWIELNGVPLAFTHDVCRLPETSLHGLTSLYMTNSFAVYSVTRSIIKKTLVIYGSSDNDFLLMQGLVDNLSADLGFHTRRCSTLNEVEDAIKLIKPEFLIFDCHGGYDLQTKSTFLFIGEERLTCEEIVNRNLHAPIVFLSACGTAPTYGTTRTVSNAFFEIGVLCVTTTYLPIQIINGTFLYYRILMKLAIAANNAINKNWLEFISHVIRTSSINEAYLDVYRITHEHDKVSDSQTDVIRRSQIFSERKGVYDKLDSILSTVSKANKKLYSERIPEYLFYSTLGRADLIMFDAWIEKLPSIATD